MVNFNFYKNDTHSADGFFCCTFACLHFSRFATFIAFAVMNVKRSSLGTAQSSSTRPSSSRRISSTAAERGKTLTPQKTSIDVRKSGLSPFMILNFRYAREDRYFGHKLVWDLNWAFYNFCLQQRFSQSILLLNSLRCVIAPCTAIRLFLREPVYSATPLLSSQTANPEISLSLALQLTKIHLTFYPCHNIAHNITFAVRHFTFRVWPLHERKALGGVSYDEFPLSVQFDLFVLYAIAN